MASITKTDKGYRVQINIKGQRRSKVLDTKAQANEWAAKTELELRTQPSAPESKKTLGDLWGEWGTRYAPQRKHGDWELKRLAFFSTDDLAKVKLNELNGSHVATWRNKRLETVSPGTVLRDWNLLSMICTVAVDEMKWLKQNPFSEAKRPSEPPPRTRIPTESELETIEHFCNPALWRVAQFAIETGMRQSEISNLMYGQITGNVANLPMTKNGKPRQVPLSAKAIALIGTGTGNIFGLKSSQIDSGWRKATAKAMVEDLHFHDLRGLAATRLSKKLNPLQLCRMFGWAKLDQAMTYYRESPDDVAKLL